jgi:hypothetical protein
MIVWISIMHGEVFVWISIMLGKILEIISRPQPKKI